MSLAPLTDRVLVLTVPGNHDEARRDRVTTPGDSWAIEAVAGAADALELSGQYDHVTFVYPEPDDLSVTVDWYRNKKGTDSVSGMLSVEQLPGAVPGWRAPVLHA